MKSALSRRFQRPHSDIFDRVGNRYQAKQDESSVGYDPTSENNDTAPLTETYGSIEDPGMIENDQLDPDFDPELSNEEMDQSAHDMMPPGLSPVEQRLFLRQLGIYNKDSNEDKSDDLAPDDDEDDL